MKRELSVAEYVTGVLQQDRAILGKTLTLMESRNYQHRTVAEEVLAKLALQAGGRSYRVGVSGLPGAGKSSFIDVLGMKLVQLGHKVAVLAIDPSSHLTGGSILGDKTRMWRLAQEPKAFVRPSPTSGSLGGVALRTREAIVVCEAAGYDVVLVETVGVGQIEIGVHTMVDSLLVLLIGGGGDELQGIKRGLLEVAHVVALNKAEPANMPLVLKAKEELTQALHLLHQADEWQVPVLTCSALEATGIDNVWQAICHHKQYLLDRNIFVTKRNEQQIQWLWHLAEENLQMLFRQNVINSDFGKRIEEQVIGGAMTPNLGAQALLHEFIQNCDVV